MTTAAPHQQSQSLGFLITDTYDPDDVGPRDSPLMTPLRPKLAPSPSPPPNIPRSQIRPNPGDAVLVTYLDNGRDPEKARIAGGQALQGPCDGDEDSPDDDSSLDGSVADDTTMTAPSNLRNLAADALQAAAYASGPRPYPGSSSSSISAHKITPDISASTRRLSLRDDHPSVPYHLVKPDMNHGPKSPPLAVLTPASGSGELPPIQMDSPRSETHGPVLPSIRSTFGEFDRLAEPIPPMDKELVPRRRPGTGFMGSPPTGMPRLPAITSTHASPPTSPNDYIRGLPSPNSIGSSPYCYGSTNGIQRPYDSSSATTETPNSDRSVSTPATAISIADRMSIDGITNPQVGPYACTVSGCTAPAFQTQYLLNSHANVHSSARPHYCSVQGCPRSEGGKGFKRKNEMIRHGLVHDSPGYVCPFCPDREHKYPRPDNLQRHVRVHHVDKDKDDPLLREVLAQRPDGPNRGRRRRGPP